MLSRLWDVTTPLDTELAGEGDDEIRALKSELKEHLEQDHHMAGILDPLQGNCDGYHNKVTLYPQESDPVIPSNAGVVYTKLIEGVQELFFKDGATETVGQITENGFLSLLQMIHNIDGNSFNLTNLTHLEGDTVQGAHKSADGTAGITTSFTYNIITNFTRSGASTYVYYTPYTVTIKNGLITSVVAGSSSYYVALIS